MKAQSVSFVFVLRFTRLAWFAFTLAAATFDWGTFW
jgi:hypothetical protein